MKNSGVSTVPGSKDDADNSKELDQRYKEGRKYVVDAGVPNGAHNRSITDVGETLASIGHFSFAEAEEVTRIRFKLVPRGTGHAKGDIVRVVFDATPVDDTTDDAIANAWLDIGTARPDSESVDVEYNELFYVPDADIVDPDKVWSQWFDFDIDSPLRRVDLHYPNGTAAASARTFDIVAEAE